MAETLIGSEIVRLGADIKEKIKQGEKIHNFTIGDFDSAIFPIPSKLQEEIIEAYKKKFTNFIYMCLLARLSDFCILRRLRLATVCIIWEGLNREPRLPCASLLFAEVSDNRHYTEIQSLLS